MFTLSFHRHLSWRSKDDTTSTGKRDIKEMGKEHFG